MTAADRPRLLRRLWLRLLATAGAAAAVLIGFWSSVEEARSPADAIPAVALGQPVEMGRTRLTPLALDWRASADGKQIVLYAMAENVTGATQVAVFGTPAHPPELLLDGAKLPAPEITLDRDGVPLGQLQPRMAERITLVWTPPAEWRPPASGQPEVTLRFDRQRFKLRDNLYGQASWLGFVPEAELHARLAAPAAS